MKRLSHRVKHAWYDRAALDAWLDARLDDESVRRHPWRRGAREHLLLRLFPERRWRASPFDETFRGGGERVRILTLVPPEDTGGGSRPAQLAAELHRRGFAIEWRWALPIHPWPRRRRPRQDGVDTRHVDEAPEATDSAALVLLEAPHPRLCDLARRGPRHGPLVYDAIDVWDGTLGAGWYDRAAEDRALAEADVLIASARRLREEVARRSGRTVELLPNAVDPGRFRTPPSAPAVLAEGTPTIVFVGALWGEWVDLDLVATLARRLPDAAIHLVGPAGGRPLPEAPNVWAHGARPREEIPAILAAADVALVPFAPGRLSAAVSPLKVFEYLAAERPVVATRLPDLEGVPGVAIADDVDAFVAAVERAAREPFPTVAVRGYLAEQTWAKRVDRLLEISRDAPR